MGGRHRVGNHDGRTWLLQRLERLSATALRVLRRERNRHQHRLLRVEPRVRARSLRLGALSEQGRTSIRRRHGAIHYGLGVFLGSFADGSLSFLYVTYGFVATVGLGLAIVAPVAALPRWFPERPGFAYGVAFVGFGIGPAANVPLMTGLLSATGGPLETFYVLGIIYAVLIGTTAWFVRYPLEDSDSLGRHLVEGESSVSDRNKTARGMWVLRDALKTWQLYALWAMFFLNTTAGLAILSEAQPMAASIGDASTDLAAGSVVTISVTDGVGRLLWPVLSDKIGGRTVFLALFSLQAMAFLLMPTLAVGGFVIFCALSMVVMSCYGGGYGTISAVVGTYYGARSLGAVYGSVFTACAVASFGAPVILARSADILGSYYPVLYTTAGLMVAGAMITLVAKPPDFSRRPG